MVLSDEQKRKLVGLYLNGVTRYVDISKMLDIPYNSVNSYMTRWKTRNNILKKRTPRVKDTLDLLPTPNSIITISELQELKFLRHFYKMYIDGKVNKAG